MGRWRHLAAALAALAAFAAPGGADANPAEPERSVAVVEFILKSQYVDLPARCPGSTSEPAEDEICMAELYEAPVRIVRHLSGPRLPRRTILRLTTHARRFPPGTVMLVVTAPFEDEGRRGQFAPWWDLPGEKGDFCLDVEALRRWGDHEVARAYAKAPLRHFRAEGTEKREEYRCIRG